MRRYTVRETHSINLVGRDQYYIKHDAGSWILPGHPEFPSSSGVLEHDIELT